MKLTKHPSVLICACFLGTMLGSGCAEQSVADPAVSEQRQIIITGASTLAPLISEMGKRFEQTHSGLRIDVQSGGSSRGVADSRSGLADIGMVSRNLKPDEADLQRFPVARDGVCVILHSSNPVTQLTNEQIIEIYLGHKRNWKDVGGADAPITVVNKAEGRSTLEVFATYFKLPTREIHADVVIGDNEQGVKTVAVNPNAIGYVSIGTAEFAHGNGVPIHLLPLSGIAASVRNVANGTFPMSRTLHLVTKAPPTGIVADFLKFAASEQVHDLVKDLSFVPIE